MVRDQQRLISFDIPRRFTGKESSRVQLLTATIPAPDVTLAKPEEMCWWDWATFLLNTAAEIEHALMVQYLFGAYSVSRGPFTPPAPPNAGALVAAWRQAILKTAKEEMAHLVTVQNLLRFIGAPLNFDREDFPFLSLLYPFRFHLEPLSRFSLAKYVAAEMPAHPQADPTIVAEIITRATQAAGGVVVNRVGPLYATLIEIFSDSSRLLDADFRPETRDTFQAQPSDWAQSPTLIVRAIGNRSEAVTALQAIAEQGEGSASGSADSHFQRFFEIYTAFPDGTPPTWQPSLPVVVNPNTYLRASQDPDVEAGRLTNPLGRAWAGLANIRYRWLLLSLAHFLNLDSPLRENSQSTSRGLLFGWIFEEMVGPGLRALSGKLTSIAARAEGPAAAACAGLPFELPYSLTLPHLERERWRLHLAILDDATHAIKGIRSLGGDDPLLVEIEGIDATRKVLITSRLQAS